MLIQQFSEILFCWFVLTLIIFIAFEYTTVSIFCFVCTLFCTCRYFEAFPNYKECYCVCSPTFPSVYVVYLYFWVWNCSVIGTFSTLLHVLNWPQVVYQLSLHTISCIWYCLTGECLLAWYYDAVIHCFHWCFLILCCYTNWGEGPWSLLCKVQCCYPRHVTDLLEPRSLTSTSGGRKRT